MRSLWDSETGDGGWRRRRRPPVAPACRPLDDRLPFLGGRPLLLLRWSVGFYFLSLSLSLSFILSFFLSTESNSLVSPVFFLSVLLWASPSLYRVSVQRPSFDSILLVQRFLSIESSALCFLCNERVVD